LLTPGWFFGFDSLMEIIAFIIAMAVAHQAMKGYNLSKEKTFLYLNLSFVLLGAGLLIESVSNFLVVLARFHRGFLILAPLGYTINFITQVLAYGVLIFTYVQQTRKMGVEVAMAAVPLLMFERNAFTELILIFLLAYIAIQTAINYSINKTTASLLVLGAFVSLVISHLFFLLFTLEPVFFAFAHTAQLFGFLLLLAMLLRVNHAR